MKSNHQNWFNNMCVLCGMNDHTDEKAIYN